MVELVVQNLTKRFGLVTAVDNVSFHIADGEFLTLLGPSGCGKSTTLAAVAGLDVPDQGLIRAGDRVFFDSAKGQVLPAEARNCGLVFQSYALWPHMTVQQNLAFPLKLRKIRSRERSARIAEALALVEMADYADRYPHQLSGGQQQRVALARTLVYQPLVLLLDEPLVQSRRQAARAGADLARPPAPEGAAHHALCHPRPDRGAGAFRPYRGDEWRAHRPARHAARDL